MHIRETPNIGAVRCRGAAWATSSYPQDPIMKRLALVPALFLALLATPAFAKSGQFDVFTDGMKAKFDVFTDGAAR